MGSHIYIVLYLLFTIRSLTRASVGNSLTIREEKNKIKECLMSVFISDIDQAKPYVQFVFRPLAHCIFIKVLIYMNNTKSGGRG